jgi:signal transduction histidine kinase
VVDVAGTLCPAAQEMLARCDRQLVQALEENRRIAHNLRPTDLDELGLVDACRHFCQELQTRTNLTVKCSIARLDHRLPPETELNLFRIVQEAINNAEKHAHANTIHLRMAFQDGTIILKIQDDGRGFDVKAAPVDKKKGHGIGLTNMRDRIASLGGTCEVSSSPLEGTAITVRVPYKAKI